jgi:hypothetical protein
MAIRYDIGLNNNDLVIQYGDFIIAESDTQHVVDTLNAFAGWWKEFPLDGVGVMQYIKSPADVQDINRNVRINLLADGYISKAPVVTLDVAGLLTINPNAEIQ